MNMLRKDDIPDEVHVPAQTREVREQIDQLIRSGRSEPRQQVAYAQEGIVNDAGDYCVVWVTEDEAGYTEMTYTGDLDYCLAVANDINTKRGYTRREVLDVVASSFAAQNAMHGLAEGEVL